MKIILFEPGAPPGKNDETQAGEGLGFGVWQTNRLGLQRDHYTAGLHRSRCEARRRECRMHSDSARHAEIFA